MKPTKFDASVSKTMKQALVTQEMLGRRPSLDLLNFYAGRPKARDEVETVLRSYLLKDQSLDKQQAKEMAARGRSLATDIFTHQRETRSSDILAALSNALIPSPAASALKARAPGKS